MDFYSEDHVHTDEGQLDRPNKRQNSIAPIAPSDHFNKFVSGIHLFQFQINLDSIMTNQEDDRDDSTSGGNQRTQGDWIDRLPLEQDKLQDSSNLGHIPAFRGYGAFTDSFFSKDFLGTDSDPSVKSQEEFENNGSVQRKKGSRKEDWISRLNQAGAQKLLRELFHTGHT